MTSGGSIARQNGSDVAGQMDLLCLSQESSRVPRPLCSKLYSSVQQPQPPRLVAFADDGRCCASYIISYRVACTSLNCKYSSPTQLAICCTVVV